MARKTGAYKQYILNTSNDCIFSPRDVSVHNLQFLDDGCRRNDNDQDFEGGARPWAHNYRIEG